MKYCKFFLIIIFSILILEENLKANNNILLIDKISKNLRCLICQGQSIYDSQSDFAISMKLFQKINLQSLTFGHHGVCPAGQNMQIL